MRMRPFEVQGTLFHIRFSGLQAMLEVSCESAGRGKIFRQIALYIDRALGYSFPGSYNMFDRTARLHRR